jgi:translation initiation factor IF-2
MIKIEAKEVGIGRLTILGIFFKKEKEMIIGGKVTEGEVRNGAEFRVWRKGESGEDEIIGQGRITSLKHVEKDIKEAKEGMECGMRVTTSIGIEIGDTLEVYTKEFTRIA